MKHGISLVVLTIALGYTAEHTVRRVCEATGTDPADVSIEDTPPELAALGREVVPHRPTATLHVADPDFADHVDAAVDSLPPEVLEYCVICDGDVVAAG